MEIGHFLVEIGSSEKDVADLVKEILTNKQINRLELFDQVNQKGIEFKLADRQIPPRLETAIKIIMNSDSGMTGLTIYEAWIGVHRQK